ncbi:MAG: hypothetical protein IJ681_01270 [Bacteroidales bacterium]|nr:hypothetical protein [Bacteroidales bacterium]
MTEAETWLMRTLELDTYEYVFIKNYHKIFAVLNKYPQQSLDYSFQRLQQKFDCFRVTTSEDKRFRCYTVPIPFMRCDAASIVYYQYLNDADSVCHFIEDTVFWLMDNIKSFDAKDRTIYVINRYDPHSGHTHCSCDFNISLIAFSVSKNKLVPEKIFPPLKSGKKSSDIEEIYDHECWNNLFGKNADKKQRFYFDEANLQYYVLINSTFCKWWPNRNEEGIKYAVYTWNGENFDKKEIRSKKLNK